LLWTRLESLESSSGFQLQIQVQNPMNVIRHQGL
jgi:hypothetical protein